jgi:hypothetical protein
MTQATGNVIRFDRTPFQQHPMDMNTFLGVVGNIGSAFELVLELVFVLELVLELVLEFVLILLVFRLCFALVCFQTCFLTLFRIFPDCVSDLC